MIGLRISKALLTAEMNTLVKVELHHFLEIAQTEGLAAPDTSLFFDVNDDGWSIDLRAPDKCHVEGVGKKSIMLMADERPQLNIQQRYHVTYCEQIDDASLADEQSEQQTEWQAQPLSTIKPKGGDAVNVTSHLSSYVVIACSPLQDAPLSELWLAGDEVRSLTSAAFPSTILSPAILFAPTTPSPTTSVSKVSHADGSKHLPVSQHSLVSKHLAWLIGALILDFPLEDALIIARASLNVSRETWPRSVDDFPIIPSITAENRDIENTSGGKSSAVGVLPISEASIPETSISDTNDNRHLFNAVNAADLSFYPVVDDVMWVDRLLRLGVKTIQLRIKNPHQADLEQQIKQAVLLGKTYQAQVFINDYWQLAIQYQAFGVHLGQDDLHTADIQALRHAGIRLGISTHGYWEILKAQQLHPSYIALGHIFPTTTKQMPSQPQGLARLRLYQQFVDSIAKAHHRVIPTVAIGGIDLNNAATVLAQGVSSLAVVRAVTQATNTASAVDDFQRLFLSREGVLSRNVQSQPRRKAHGIAR
ncbi:thiamine phosphate synthase [Vibrio spartinae]|uniref:Thiamine-phosphate synthase n=1 Tax=Vibrio spartinae TaxID=1918945 RepID=A0A1N6MA97_9VIBR|nr:thiamine phosphate synthase [Vibrio spartinae]SIO96331.1 Thiamine-phosphate synthase [Vibrio spartinae]